MENIARRIGIEENAGGSLPVSAQFSQVIKRAKRACAQPFVGVSRAKRRRALAIAVFGALLIIASVLLMNLETPRVSRSEPATQAAVVASPGAASPAVEIDLASLKAKGLLLPVKGVTPNQLRDSFLDGRSEGRLHQALDIMAPQGTPVLATVDGAVMKLHTSARGGIMLYQSDSAGPYVYYYAHLSGYADGIAEGKKVNKGEVIAYVGDTGNAGPGNYHLHFGISRMTAPGRWSGGEPINPYPLLAGR